LILQTRARRPARRLFVGLLLLLALGVSVRLALPSLVELVVEAQLSQALFAPVEIEAVRLDLRRGEVVLEELVVRDHEGEAVLAAARRATMDVDWAALLSGSLRAEHLTLEAPELMLRFDEQGQFNWGALTQAPEASSSGDEASAFWLEVDRLEFGEAVLLLIDESPDSLPDLRLQVGHFALLGAELGRRTPSAPLVWALASAETDGWQLSIAPDADSADDFDLDFRAGPKDPDGALPVRLALSRENGVQLGLEGEIHPETLDLEMQIGWKELPSRGLFPLMAIAGARLLQGVSDGELEVELRLSDLADRGLRVAGSMTHRDLVVVLEESEEGESATLELARARVELSELYVPIAVDATDSAEAVRVYIERIEIEGPRVDATRRSLAQPAVVADEPTVGLATAEVVDLDLRVETVSLRDGALHVRDPSVGDDLPEISGVTASAQKLHWPSATIEAFDLSIASLGEKPLRATGSWAPGHADVEMRATRISLAPFSPFISRYSSYSVSDGMLSLRSALEIRGEVFEASTRLAVQGLEAQSEGQEFQKLFGIPMAAAIPMLSDTAGNIILDVPVAGDLSASIEFDVVLIIRNAMQVAISNAIVGNAIAPSLDLVGAALRRAGEVFSMGIGEAAFLAGDDSLAIDARAVLSSAAKLVRSTPGARIILLPQITTDDMAAFDLRERPDGLDGLIDVGRGLFGGSHPAEAQHIDLAEELAKRRVQIVTRYLEEQGLEGRIDAEPWDERLYVGYARVMLRMQRDAQ
jgi:hypothetical protein